MDRAIRIALLALPFMLVALPAHAYLDPGSGSMILQIIAGGIAGLAVALKMFWHRIRGFFGGGNEPQNTPPT